MKKLISLITIQLVLFNCLYAGQGGPDLYGYTWIDSNEPGGPVYSWVDIANPLDGIQIFGLGDDNFVGPFVIANGTFQYYWYDVDQFWIGSNGYISFNPVNISSPFPTIVPQTAAPNDFIAAMMSDLNFSNAPNAQCWIARRGDSTIISYINVPFWNTPANTGLNTFQIILNGADKSITINIQSQTGLAYSTNMLIGIENLSGTIGLAHSVNIYPQSLYTIRFNYPSIVSYQVTDGSVQWNDNEGSRGSFIRKNGGAYVMKTKVKNSGNQALSSFSLNGEILNSIGAPVASGMATVPPLTPSQDTLITFTNTFNPTVAGTFTFRSTLSGIVGDLTPGNNTVSKELIVVDTTLANIWMEYTDGMPGGGGISWVGGDGGIGVYFKPPNYPADLKNTRFYIQSNPQAVGFRAMIYADDGFGGSPGTLLDSVFVPGSSIVTGTYTVVPLSQPAIISSGGVYILWLMSGEGIQLATDDTPPFSRQCYEVLGGIWSPYRSFTVTDFMLGLDYQPIYVQDLGVSTIVGPVGLVAGSPLVSVRLKNFGQVTLSGFDVSYRLANGPVITQAYQGSAIAPGDSVLFTFSTPLNISPGSGDLCVWTSSSTIADVNSNNDTACVAITVNSSGLEDQTANAWTLAPNPASTNIAIIGAEGKGTLRVYDSRGALLIQQKEDSLQKELYVGQLAAGVYTLEIIQGDQRQVMKFVKH